MMITVKETTMVKPSDETPRHGVYMSSLDLMVNAVHISGVAFFAPPPKSIDLVGAAKESLGKVLVPFYPVAGRFGVDRSGRTELNCNADGVLFVAAEADITIDDFLAFYSDPSSPELLSLVPFVDRSLGVSSFPLFASQITFFKCGGISISIAIENRLADGFSIMHFLNSWSQTALGFQIITPFLDRTILSSSNPPKPPKFNHIEYQSPPTLLSPLPNNYTVVTKTFLVTKEQQNTMKSQSNNKYTTYEILAGHIWKCACMARDLPNDQQTKLFFVVNGRFSRLKKPSLPLTYFGNAVFAASSLATVGDLKSKPKSYAASEINKTLTRMDDEYLRSAIDFLEARSDSSRNIGRGAHIYRSPNLGVTSLARVPMRGVDSVWGQPKHMVMPCGDLCEGKSYILPTAQGDGSLSVVLALQLEHMEVFEKLFYDEMF